MSDMNAVYHERNMLVAYLATCYPSHLARHPEEDVWDDDWRWLVCIHTPAGQMTWHLHDSEYPLFTWIPEQPNDWDGHTTDEKYTCLLGLIMARARPRETPPLVLDQGADPGPQSRAGCAAGGGA